LKTGKVTGTYTPKGYAISFARIYHFGSSIISPTYDGINSIDLKTGEIKTLEIDYNRSTAGRIAKLHIPKSRLAMIDMAVSQKGDVFLISSYLGLVIRLKRDEDILTVDNFVIDFRVWFGALRTDNEAKKFLVERWWPNPIYTAMPSVVSNFRLRV